MAAVGQTLVIADDTSLGHRLRIARIAAGLEQVDMAKALGVSARTYQRIESDDRTPSALELAELARITGQDLTLFTTSAADEEAPILPDPLPLVNEGTGAGP